MDQKFKALENWFLQHPRVLVALSGGVDSCLVAFVARKVCDYDNAIAVIGDSASLKRRDLDIALTFCNDNNIRYQLIQPNEINDPNYRQNPVDRCYWCKSSLYQDMIKLRNEQYPDYTMVNGNNKSDWSDYRPGLKAADQFEALSPLADCGMVKDDIRDMAHHFGLAIWDKPASPCLSSRFPYGELITIEKLKQVEDAETVLSENGFADARVRYFGTKARVEVPAFQINQLKQKISLIKERFEGLGFVETEIDEEGLVSGKLNREIQK